MNELEKIKIWESLKKQINKIQDPKTHQMYFKALLVRFVNSYGFNPENATVGQINDNTVEFDDWEKGLLDDIECYNKFGIDMGKERRKSEEREFCNNMRLFVMHGGQFSDIPENIQSSHVLHAYVDAILAEGRDIDAMIDNLQGAQQ